VDVQSFPVAARRRRSQARLIAALWDSDRQDLHVLNLTQHKQ
jgi:hypothetical protein